VTGSDGGVCRGLTLSAVATAASAVVIYHSRGDEGALAFAACYLLELSLSVDNMFAFYLLFQYFRTPPELQPIALAWGITGAIVLRALALILGLAAITAMKPLLLLFAVALIYSAYGVLSGGGDDDDDDMSEKRVVRLVKQFIPVTAEYHANQLFAREGGRWRATPLFMVLVCIELSDILFAIDSVPAVLGMSSDTLIVYLAVMCAVLSLRSVYIVTVLLIERFAYLPTAVALLLVFIGFKIVADVLFGYALRTGASLVVIAFILGGGVMASVLSGAQPKVRSYQPVLKSDRCDEHHDHLSDA